MYFVKHEINYKLRFFFLDLACMTQIYFESLPIFVLFELPNKCSLKLLYC